MSDNPTSKAGQQAQAIRWLTRQSSGEFSKSEQRALDEWLAQDQANRDEYERIRSYLESVSQLTTPSFPELREARAYGKLRLLPYAAAAGVAFLAIISALWWSKASLDDPAQTFATAKGEQKSIVLADGTQVNLNTNTRISVNFDSSSRNVLLEQGEAYFTIGEDRHRPFEITAGEGRIRDIGTKFNVFNNAGDVSVVVTEGRVMVETSQSGHFVSMGSGSRLNYDPKGNISKYETVDVHPYIAWLSGRLSFKETSLDELAAQVSRYHDVRFVFEDSKVRDFRVSGTFKASELDSLLSALEAKLPVTVTWLNQNTVKFSYNKNFLLGLSKTFRVKPTYGRMSDSP